MARRLESLFIMRKPVSHTVMSVRYHRGTMARRLESFLVSILCRTNAGLMFLDSVTRTLDSVLPPDSASRDPVRLTGR